MTTAAEALERLKAGNERYASDVRDAAAQPTQARRNELADQQAPFAIILGCSDSRVPAELVFDQGLGDLFVVRVAGNIVAPSLIGSMEFSALTHGARLIVVLGHTSCGAVQATVDGFDQPLHELSPNLAEIVTRIRPSVSVAMASGPNDDRDALVQRATHANIRSSVLELRDRSRVLAELMASDGLKIIGAEYSLKSGRVTFFDEAPD